MLRGAWGSPGCFSLALAAPGAPGKASERHAATQRSPRPTQARPGKLFNETWVCQSCVGPVVPGPLLAAPGCLWLLLECSGLLWVTPSTRSGRPPGEATKMTRSSEISTIARAGARIFWDTGLDPRHAEHLKESKIKG